MKTIGLRPTFTLCIGFCGMACGGADLQAPGEAGEIDGRELPLVGMSCGSSNVTEITSNGGFEFGPRTGENFCFLTRVEGLAGSERAYATVDQWGDETTGFNWVIVGYGTMSCVPTTCFSHPSSSAVAWHQPMYFSTSFGPNCTNPTNMFWGDAANVVQGIRNFNAPQGYVEIPNQPGASLQAGDTCGGGYVEGLGTSFYVGVPGTGDETSTTGPYSATFLGTTPTITDMVSVTTGVCFFTGVYQLGGQGEYARIQRSGSKWILKVNGSSAAAHCLKYQQN